MTQTDENDRVHKSGGIVPIFCDQKVSENSGNKKAQVRSTAAMCNRVQSVGIGQNILQMT